VAVPVASAAPPEAPLPRLEGAIDDEPEITKPPRTVELYEAEDAVASKGGPKRRLAERNAKACSTQSLLSFFQILRDIVKLTP